MGMRAIALVALLAGVSHATVMRELSLEHALELSDHVVVGVVLSSEAQLHPYGRIVTHTRVRAEAWLAGRGAPGETLEVLHPGGEVGDLGMLVHGMPRFVEGERVLLFLGSLPQNGLTTVGGFQGAYAIEDHEDGSRVAVQKTTHGALLVGGLRGSTLPLSIELESFSRAIAAEAGTP